MKSARRDTIISYAVITLGAIIMAAGIYFFKFPNNFSTGGVSALSILLAAVIPGITPGEYMILANMILLVIGLIVFGKGFAFKTIYCSTVLSLMTRLFEIYIPLSDPITNQKLLELFFAIGLTAVGSAMIFNEKASSGGTDIVAMILKKFSNLDIGKALLCSDFILAMASAFVFDIETCLFSLFGLVLKAFVVDNVIDSINLTKCFVIVTEKDKEICDFINNILHRGATVSVCEGAFTNDSKKMIITVLKRNQAAVLKMYIKQVDKSAFTVITNSSDILGKGFRTVI